MNRMRTDEDILPAMYREPFPTTSTSPPRNPLMALQQEQFAALTERQTEILARAATRQQEMELRSSRLAVEQQVMMSAAETARDWLATRRPGEGSITIECEAESYEKSFLNILGAGRGERFRARYSIHIGGYRL